jgi:hypothetical protein
MGNLVYGTETSGLFATPSMKASSTVQILMQENSFCKQVLGVDWDNST